MLGKHIGRLADGANHIVGVGGQVARNILYLVISLVERGTDKVGETCIDNGELFDGSLFYI